MSTDMKKIIVCGDVHGKIDVVFKRVEKLIKKGNNFDMLFCIGSFFDDETSLEVLADYQNGSRLAPVPTFLLGPNTISQENYFLDSDENGFELCDNITFLGKKGTYRDSSGLTVAYLSGIEQQENEKAQIHTFNKADVKSLVSSATQSRSSDFFGVDILLTSSWPQGVTNYGNAPTDDKCSKCGSKLIAQLAVAIKPRYHFTALEGVHYERVPYRNHVVLNESTRHVTRFVALAPVGNTSKQKYMYAFSISPMISMKPVELIKQPQDVTECPYYKQDAEQVQSTMQQSLAILADEEDTQQFRWNLSSHPQQDRRGYKRKNDAHGGNDQPYKKTERPQDWACWFCLGGEKVEKHLVASVGNLTYIAMAKGSMVNNHVLILPIAHHSSSMELPDDTAIEVQLFKKSITAAFKKNDQHCVIFERNFRSDHLQLQVVPLPSSISSSDLRTSFINAANNNVDRNGKPRPLEFAELPQDADIKKLLGMDDLFFHVELPDGSQLLHKIKGFFPLQFGREVIAGPKILNEPDLGNWRNCVVSMDDEVKQVANFRELFKPFDFTLEDDDDD